MDVSILDSTLKTPDVGRVAPSLLSQATTRADIFRFLLVGAAKQGSRVVDLAAGPCIFARMARDQGYVVTAVDARTERKPPDSELGTIRFVKADIRDFDVQGFDVIVCLGVLYHLDAADQERFLEKCAKSGVPMILETQIHVPALVPDAETGEWARKLVRRGQYEGVVFREGDNLMASVGNTESFWATEPSLLSMIENAGFRRAAIVDPIFQSKYGARRYFLLNGDNFAANPEIAATIALRNERAIVVELVDQGRFDTARELFEQLPREMKSTEDWPYAVAGVKMWLHFGESDKAISKVKRLRDHALGFGERSAAALLRCAEFFERLGDAGEAEKSRMAAFGCVGDPALIKSLLQKSIESGAVHDTRRLLARLEERFADNIEMLILAANTYYAIGDFEAAERLCRSEPASKPAIARLHANLGHLQLRRGDTQGAVASFDHALAQDPGNPDILESLASIHLEMKDKERAELYAREFVGVAPLNAKAHIYLARALRGRRRNAEALEHAKRASELNPGNERYREIVRILTNPAKAGRGRPG